MKKNAAQRNELLRELRELTDRMDRIRRSLSVSRPEEVIHMADAGDGEIVVEADGFGGALLQVVCGNYPIDYCVSQQKRFKTEKAAIAAADAMH